MNYARRQQYRRIRRAGEMAFVATVLAVLGLGAASIGAGLLAAVLLIGAVGLGVYARHCFSLADRSRVGARSEEADQRALVPLEAEGWRLRHSLRWAGRGDIDSVAIAPTGIAICHRDEDQKLRPRPPGTGPSAGCVAVASPKALGTQWRPRRDVRRQGSGRRVRGG